MVPEALDHAWIRAELAARRGVVGTPLCFEAQVGSTSDLARELAIAGAPHGTTVVADEQVAGRGRRGASRWQTPPRVSIALSTVLRPPGIDPSSLGRLGLCIAIATAEAIEGSTGAHVMVKWPNDLVVEARGDLVGTILKLGGILVEPAILAVVPPRVGHVVVGIGVNANLAAASMAPTDADALAPVALVDIVGHAVSRERLVVEILEAVGGASDGWSDATWPSWRARYEARMVWRGVEVIAEGEASGSDRHHGRLMGIDPSGALVIVGDDGTASRVMTGRLRANLRTQSAGRGVSRV
jgi:BirA family biotin operon repressor/biotin-[acetyl-CoA-carboxylase] ligase